MGHPKAARLWLVGAVEARSRIDGAAGMKCRAGCARLWAEMDVGGLGQSGNGGAAKGQVRDAPCGPSTRAVNCRLRPVTATRFSRLTDAAVVPALIGFRPALASPH